MTAFGEHPFRAPNSLAQWKSRICELGKTFENKQVTKTLALQSCSGKSDSATSSENFLVLT